MDIEGLYLRGKEAADNGNYDYAIALFLDIIRANPEHVNSRRALRGCEVARFQEKGGSAKVSGFFKGFGHLLTAFLPGVKPAKAADHCEQYLVNDPTSTAILCRLAKSYEKMGYLDAATDTLEFARQRAPEDVAVLRRLGQVCHKKGDFEKAIRSFQDIVRIKPSDRDAVQRAKEISAEFHLKKSHMEGSSSYRDSLRDADQAGELEKEQRVARSDDEKSSRIQALLAKAKEDPKDPKALRDLGEAFFQAERFAEAEKVFAKELEITKMYSARERLGQCPAAAPVENRA